MKVYIKEDVDTHLRSADINMKWMLVARITAIEANEKLKEVGSDLKNKLKKQAKITEQMRELKKAQLRCTRCPEEGHLKKAERY